CPTRRSSDLPRGPVRGGEPPPERPPGPDSRQPDRRSRAAARGARACAAKPRAAIIRRLGRAAGWRAAGATRISAQEAGGGREVTGDFTLVVGNKNYSSWSLRGFLACRLAGVPFDEILVRLSEPGTRDELLKHSPAGKVPVLK